MLACLRIFLLSSIALLPAFAMAATPKTEAEKQAAAKALAEVTSICDKGAAVPLDPEAKAPPVQYYQFFPDDFDMKTVEALQRACQQAWAGAPKEKRLQLQWLRVTAALGKTDQEWLIVPQIKAFADAGNAEAQFLMLRLFRPHPAQGSAPSIITRNEALAYLNKAAEQGHLTALFELMTQYRGGQLLRRDLGEAVRIGRRIDGAPPQGIAETQYETRMRQAIAVNIAMMTLEEDGFPAAEQRIAFATVKKDSADGSNENYSALRYIGALRYGRGTDKDPAKARKILEARLATSKDGLPMLADMLARGEGGPADAPRALAMLRSKDGQVYGTSRVLAGLLLDGSVVGTQPQEAIRLLAPSWDTADQIRVAALLVDYHPQLNNSAHIIETLSDAAAVGEPGAAIALAKLKLSDNGQFTDIAGARALLKPLADAGDRPALWLYASSQYANLKGSSSQPYRQPDGYSDDELKRVIADGMEKKEPEAYLLAARLTRKGVVYPQDDQAATNLLIRAANLGSVEGMVALGNAYSDGLGTPKNPKERLHAWREAAKRGSLTAQANLGNAFIFDTFGKLMNLDEGVTGPLVLFINGTDRSNGMMSDDMIASVRLSNMFSFGSRAMEAGAPAVADAVMNAFVKAPAGLDDKTMVTIGKALSDEIRVAIETKLKSDGFYSGTANGYFGPDVRQALVKWAQSRPPIVQATVPVIPQDDAKPKTSDLVAADILARVTAQALKDSNSAKTNRQKLTAISAINVLAQYGEISARWALVSNYHQVNVVRKIVSPAELTRYALDVMVTKPAGAEKAEFDFIFDITQMQQDGQIRTFGKAVLAAVRDDTRLQDPLTLGGIMKQFIFAPGACDAMLDASKRAGIKNVGQDGCDDQTMAALIAFAKASGPAGIDATARKDAAEEIKAMDTRLARE